MGRCLNCREKFQPRYFLDKFCGEDSCKESENKYKEEKLKERQKKPNLQLSKMKPIKKVSDKRALENIIYKSERIKFLQLPENKKCFIEGCNSEADTIEHIMGRKGFADEYARENNISLYLDKRFWKPCCLKHNLELENNPELSKKYQLSKISGKPKL